MKTKSKPKSAKTLTKAELLATHRLVQSTKSPWTAEDKARPWTCPTCGDETLNWVTEDCSLLDGVVVPQLEHLKCANCGERCFDIDAMERIRLTRQSLQDGGCFSKK